MHQEQRPTTPGPQPQPRPTIPRERRVVPLFPGWGPRL